jgi:hypothetical protein
VAATVLLCSMPDYGTTGLAAQRAGNRYIGVDAKAEYLCHYGSGSAAPHTAFSRGA